MASRLWQGRAAPKDWARLRAASLAGAPPRGGRWRGQPAGLAHAPLRRTRGWHPPQRALWGAAAPGATNPALNRPHTNLREREVAESVAANVAVPSDLLASEMRAMQQAENGDWRLAWDVLRHLEDEGVKASLQCYKAVMRAMLRDGEPALAVNVVKRATEAEITVDTDLLVLLIRAYGRSTDWRGALATLLAAERSGHAQLRALYTAAIEACASAGRYAEARELLRCLATSRRYFDEERRAIALRGVDTVAAGQYWLLRSARTRDLVELSHAGEGEAPEVRSVSRPAENAAAAATGKGPPRRRAAATLRRMRAHQDAASRSIETTLAAASVDVASAIFDDGPTSPSSAVAAAAGVETGTGSGGEGGAAAAPVTCPLAIYRGSSLPRGTSHDLELLTYDAAPFVGTMRAATSAGRSWHEVLLLLAEMGELGVVPNAAAFDTAVGACARAGQWPQVCALLQEMHERGLPRSSAAYSDAISACAKAGHPREAATLFAAMRHDTSRGEAPLEASPHALRTLLGVLASRPALWEPALSVFAALLRSGTSPDLHALRHGLEAAANGARWTLALQLLALLRDRASGSFDPTGAGPSPAEDGASGGGGDNSGRDKGHSGGLAHAAEAAVEQALSRTAPSDAAHSSPPAAVPDATAHALAASACARAGRLGEALALVKEMEATGHAVPRPLYRELLCASALAGDAKQAQTLARRLAKSAPVHPQKRQQGGAHRSEHSAAAAAANAAFTAASGGADSGDPFAAGGDAHEEEEEGAVAADPESEEVEWLLEAHRMAQAWPRAIAAVWKEDGGPAAAHGGSDRAVLSVLASAAHLTAANSAGVPALAEAARRALDRLGPRPSVLGPVLHGASAAQEAGEDMTPARWAAVQTLLQGATEAMGSLAAEAAGSEPASRGARALLRDGYERVCALHGLATLRHWRLASRVLAASVEAGHSCGPREAALCARACSRAGALEEGVLAAAAVDVSRAPMTAGTACVVAADALSHADASEGGERRAVSAAASILSTVGNRLRGAAVPLTQPANDSLSRCAADVGATAGRFAVHAVNDGAPAAYADAHDLGAMTLVTRGLPLFVQALAVWGRLLRMHDAWHRSGAAEARERGTSATIAFAGARRTCARHCGSHAGRGGRGGEAHSRALALTLTHTHTHTRPLLALAMRSGCALWPLGRVRRRAPHHVRGHRRVAAGGAGAGGPLRCDAVYDPCLGHGGVVAGDEGGRGALAAAAAGRAALARGPGPGAGRVRHPRLRGRTGEASLPRREHAHAHGVGARRPPLDHPLHPAGLEPRGGPRRVAGAHGAGPSRYGPRRPCPRSLSTIPLTRVPLSRTGMLVPARGSNANAQDVVISGQTLKQWLEQEPGEVQRFPPASLPGLQGLHVRDHGYAGIRRKRRTK